MDNNVKIYSCLTIKHEIRISHLSIQPIVFFCQTLGQLITVGSLQLWFLQIFRYSNPSNHIAGLKDQLPQNSKSPMSPVELPPTIHSATARTFFKAMKIYSRKPHFCMKKNSLLWGNSLVGQNLVPIIFSFPLLGNSRL